MVKRDFQALCRGRLREIASTLGRKAADEEIEGYMLLDLPLHAQIVQSINPKT